MITARQITARPIAAMAIFAAAASVTPAIAADAPAWTVDADESRLGFVASQGGASFEGAFEDWSAEIRFDPENLEGSSIDATIALKSAKTGDKDRDSALPGRDWFDVKKTPTATYVANEIVAAPGGEGYVAKGILTLRGIEKPLDLAFDVSIDGDKAAAEGETVIARTEYGVGQGDFSTGKWVGLDVTVKLSIAAAR
ncbi:MAG: YceI family protein [Pseudomonadota bacterium]